MHIRDGKEGVAKPAFHSPPLNLITYSVIVNTYSVFSFPVLPNSLFIHIGIHIFMLMMVKQKLKAERVFNAHQLFALFYALLPFPFMSTALVAQEESAKLYLMNRLFSHISCQALTDLFEALIVPAIQRLRKWL